MNLFFIKLFFLFLISINFTLYFLGLLRPTVFLDYLDNWFISLFPIFLIYINRKLKNNYYFEISLFFILILTYSSFPLLTLNNSSLIQNSYFPSFELDNIKTKEFYEIIIDIDEAVHISSYEGESVFVDIINRPGATGYPEAVYSTIGSPNTILFRQMDSSKFYTTKGWDIKLNQSNLWKLDIFSIESSFTLDNLHLDNSSITGSGDISLGSSLESNDITIKGNFNIKVSKDLPVVVIGNAQVPSGWINATIGYLNMTEENYKFKIYISEGSNVKFIDG